VKSSTRSGPALFGATVLLTLVAPVAAQSTADKALAEALFQDGRALLSAGKISDACGKFLESERIEPKLGTLLNLAACHEAQGKTASAWAEFAQAVARAQQAHQPEREAFAREHRANLARRLSMLNLCWEKPEARETVQLDGLLLKGEAIGTPFPVDPGEHGVVASAPGRDSWHRKFIIEAGPSSLSLTIPELSTAPTPEEADEPAPAPVPVAATASPVSSSEHGAPASDGVARPRPTSPEPHAMSTAHVAGLLTGGVALLAGGLGAYYGVRALDAKSAAEKECTGAACSATGLALHDDVKRYANVSTVSFAAGALSLGASIYLLTRRDAPPKGAHGPVAVDMAAGAGNIGGALRIAW
jgi:hypothetical protein